MPRSRVICSCGAVLKKDEREHYLYHCTSCVVAEHDLIRRHQRGEDHPDIDALFDGPVPSNRYRSTRRGADHPGATDALGDLVSVLLEPSGGDPRRAMLLHG